MEKLYKDLRFMRNLALISLVFLLVPGMILMIATRMEFTAVLGRTLGLFGAMFLMLGGLTALASRDGRGSRHAVVKPYGLFDFFVKLTYVASLVLSTQFLEHRALLVLMLTLILMVLMLVSTGLLHKAIQDLDDTAIKEAFMRYYNPNNADDVDQAVKQKGQLSFGLWWAVFILTFVRFEFLMFSGLWLMWLFYAVYALYAWRFLRRLQKSSVYGDQPALVELQYVSFLLGLVLMLVLEVNTPIISFWPLRLLVSLVVWMIPLYQYFKAHSIIDMTQYAPTYEAFSHETSD